MMRRYCVPLIIIVFCVLIAITVSKETTVYISPEEYCQSKGYENYQIVSGESSVYIVYRESFSKVDYIMLKATRTGWVPIGYSIVSREPFSPFTATIYKGRGTDDNYIILSISGRYNEKVIKDARESTFYFIPLFTTAEEKMELCSYAFAYIGTESKDYYRNDYWFVVETDYNTN